jgi:Cu2+-containing amine oxidase
VANLARKNAAREPVGYLLVPHNLGVTHLARLAEWPIMPVTRVGFKLIPCDFFDRNPALDVP